MDEQIRQRVIGGIVLAVLGIVLLPLIFGSPRNPTESIQSSFDGEPLKLRPGGQAVPPRVLRDAQSPPPERVELVATPTPRREVSPPVTQTSATAKPTPPIRPKSTPPPSTPRPQAQTQAKGPWILQLASFSNPDNAERLRARLVANGHKAYVEPVVVERRKLYRVRVGPILGKSNAQSTKAQLEKQYKVKIRLYPAGQD